MIQGVVVVVLLSMTYTDTAFSLSLLFLLMCRVALVFRSKVVKNKVAPPYKLAEFDILFGGGISALGCLLDAAEAVEVVQRRGSWYYFGEQRLAQGRDKTLEALKEDGDLKM